VYADAVLQLLKNVMLQRNFEKAKIPVFFEKLIQCISFQLQLNNIVNIS